MASPQNDIDGVKRDDKTRQDKARRQSEIRNRSTPEQKAMDDEWQSLLGLYSSPSQDSLKAPSRRAEAASESNEPSVHSASRLLEPNHDQPEEIPGSSTKSTRGILGSSAIPMRPYRSSKYPGVDVFGRSVEQEQESRVKRRLRCDGTESCWDRGCWCTNWGCWTWLGCCPMGREADACCERGVGKCSRCRGQGQDGDSSI